MTLNDIRAKYLAFFAEKGHAIIPSASVVPENDPTVLFTTAGMQPLVPYLSGTAHPMGSRLADAQKCLRTDDIEEVGDNRHLTFFEMLGNWSLGDYFKPESIGWSFELLTDKRWFGLDAHRIYVTVFEGDADAPQDEESIGIWQAQFEMLGIAANLGVALQDEPTKEAVGPRIYAYPKKKNWWPGPTMKGLCGPDTEIFYDTGTAHDPSFGAVCHPNCDCGRFVEIWNNVFMQFMREEEGGPLKSLPSKNVDTGMGMERMAAVVNGVSTVFDLQEFQLLMNTCREFAGSSFVESNESTRSLRIIADHTRAAVFVIGDPRGVVPSNVGQGYIVRRLLRHAIREGRKIGITENFLMKLASTIIGQFGSHYVELETNREKILAEISKEEEKFAKTIEKGMKELEKMLEKGSLTGEQAFVLFSTYGFPLELTEEILREKGAAVDREAFSSEFKKHQELSRTASAGMFKGGLADDSAETVRLHTAHHLLLKALQTVLGPEVKQRGSNITAERLRIDFSWGEKMTDEQKAEVERIVNEEIQKDEPVIKSELPLAEAEKLGAQHEFGAKYPERVTVYSVGPKTATVENPQFETSFSLEFCGGPHVTHTGELGSFKIQKEEAVSAGVRRIKATVTGMG